MSENLVNVRLHGVLGLAVGERWSLSISNIAEAIHAIEIISGRKLYKFLLDSDKNNIKYQIVVNDSVVKKTFDETDLSQIKNSELMIGASDLSSIDIIPVIEGASDGLDYINIFLGATLIFASFFAGPYGPTLFLAGLGLLFNGISNLLAKPPDMESFREIQNTRQSVSYLFNGPENTVFEGGPVPVGYGRLIVGSQGIATNFVIIKKPADDTTAGANASPLPNNIFLS